MTIIFDFDGTVGDTLENGFLVIQKFAPQYGVRAITRDDMQRYRKMRPREIMRDLNVSITKLPFFAKRFREEAGKTIPNCKPYSGIKTTLKSLRKNGIQTAILTSNSIENVKAFLVANNMLELFDIIDSETNLFGKHRALKRLMKKFAIKKDDIIYVGDEVRDIEACKKIAVPIISVTWGFNERKILGKLQPEYLIDKPKEILEIMMLT